MSSADHEHLKVDGCNIRQAANGGWVVYIPGRPGEYGLAIAAVSGLAGLMDWLKDNLDA